MKEQTVRRITTWSYSRWTTYEDCPARARYKFLDRLPDPSGPAADRGTALHKAAELYVKGEEKKLHPELKLVADDLKRLKKLKADCELELAVTADWAPIDWFGAKTWCRAKIDAVAKVRPGTVEVTDHKSGRYKPGDEGYGRQLGLYAAFIFAHDETAETVESRLLFVDHGKVEPMTFTRRENFAELKEIWADRTQAMLNDTRFDPTPGPVCRQYGGCAFSKMRGGPCEH